jgi:hypothetical protein
MKYLIIAALCLASCASMWDTMKDTSTVAGAAGVGALFGGPVTATLAGGAAYLLVDDTNNIEFIEKHVVKTVVQKEVISPTISVFWAKYRFWVILALLGLFMLNPQWLPDKLNNLITKTKSLFKTKEPMKDTNNE